MGGFGQNLPGLAGVPPERRNLLTPPIPPEQLAEFYKLIEQRRAQGLPDLPPGLMNSPIMRYLGEHFGQAVGGGQQLFGPGGTSFDERAQGASNLVRGSLPFLLPLAGPAALEAPVGALLGVGAAELGSQTGETVASKLGAGPGVSSLVGDIAGAGAGGLFAGTTGEDLADAAMAAGRAFDRLPLGSERGGIRLKGPPPTVRDLMESPLDLPGKGLTHDLGAALDNSIKARFRLPRFGKGSDPVPYQQRAVEMMRGDVGWALENVKGAGDWYTKMVDAMEDRMAKNRPEFRDPTKRALFKYLLAVTSSGIDPQANFDAAMKGWDIYMRDGKFNAHDLLTPSEFNPNEHKGLTMRAPSYKGTLENLNRLIQDQGGEAGAVKWLQTEHTFSELRKYETKSGVEGAATYEKRLGAYILGEKVGSFGSNLNGIHTELTADKWWSRTWNRWMGTVMKTDAKGNPVMDEKTGLPMLQDDPRNFGEREVMRKAAAQVAAELGLNVDELQALLWYTEQGLYHQHGIDATSIDYDQASRIHFERAAPQPGETAGNRPPPAAGRPNAERGALERGAPEAPAGVSGGRAQRTPEGQ